MQGRIVSVVSLYVALVAMSTTSAQVAAAPDSPITYGHHHLNVTSIDQHKKFWVDTLGGTPVKIGATENVKFPGVLVRLRQQVPTGGTNGSTVNHIGFQVQNVRTLVDKLKAAGFPMVTQAEVTSPAEFKDDVAHILNQNSYVALTMGPDETRVELVENKALMVPIALHHVHFAAQKVEDMRAWYVKAFNAKPGRRGSFETADLPGVSLSWMPSSEPVVGTKGRVLDHIGFEVKGLEAFCKQLESMGVTFDRPYSKVPELNLSNAFIIDPWGTYIELTEGLDKF